MDKKRLPSRKSKPKVASSKAEQNDCDKNLFRIPRNDGSTEFDKIMMRQPIPQRNCVTRHLICR